MIYNRIKETAKKYPNKVALICKDKQYTYSELISSVDKLTAVLITAVFPGEKILFASEKEYHYVRMVLACDKLKITFMPTYPNLPNEVVDNIVKISKPKHVILSEKDAEELKPHNKGLVYSDTNDYVYTVLFTSGTSGEPKAVMHSNYSCYTGCMSSIETYNMTSDDVVLAQLPPPTVAGLYLYTLPGLMSGCTVIMEQFNPRRYAEIHNEYKPTISIIVPAMVVAMSKIKSWKELDLSHSRELSVGSTIIPEEMLKLLFDKGAPVIRDLYGCTETHVPPFTYLIKPDEPHKLQLELNDRYEYKLDRYNVMWLRGDPLMLGYINEDAKFDADGYWCTGDVFERKHNKLFYKSRKKDLIKVNSYNVSPISIENAISVYPGVIEVCVTYRSRSMGEKEIVALVSADGSINTSELFSFIKEKLFAYELPKEIVIIEEPLIRNRMGKIQREDNRKKFVK